MRTRIALEAHHNSLISCLCCTLLSCCLQTRLGNLELDFKEADLPGKQTFLCMCLLQEGFVDHKREKIKVFFSAASLTYRNSGVILLQNFWFSRGHKPILNFEVVNRPYLEPLDNSKTIHVLEVKCVFTFLCE